LGEAPFQRCLVFPVKGHGFSRAKKTHLGDGLQPWVTAAKADFSVHRLAGLKPGSSTNCTAEAAF